MRIGIIDANQPSNRAYKGQIFSVVGGWLQWELDRAGVTPADPANSDILLLAFAGNVDWAAGVRSAYRYHGIDPDSQYIITGGMITANPQIAFEYVHALAIGEAYQFVRTLCQKVQQEQPLPRIRRWIRTYDHAIEIQQFHQVAFDPNRPWKLAEPADPIASPDTWVDWGNLPPVRSSDKVIRLIGSKGCHRKCPFCATTYSQSYRVNPYGGKLVATMNKLQARGERVQILSNDPAHLPFFRKVHGRMDSQSFTIDQIRDRGNRRTLIRAGVGMARFGIEGISERIRRAFSKPIANTELYEILGELHQHMDTHLFFIVGVPFETPTDWNAFKRFFATWSDQLDSRMCRIKLTTFLPAPPAPLARFLPGLQYHQRMEDFMDWRAGNYANPHFLIITGRQPQSHVEDMSEQINMPADHIADLLQDRPVYDLAPTFAEWRKCPWELIEWPLSAQQRYRISQVFARKMTERE